MYLIGTHNTHCGPPMGAHKGENIMAIEWRAGMTFSNYMAERLMAGEHEHIEDSGLCVCPKDATTLVCPKEYKQREKCDCAACNASHAAWKAGKPQWGEGNGKGNSDKRNPLCGACDPDQPCAKHAKRNAKKPVAFNPANWINWHDFEKQLNEILSGA